MRAVVQRVLDANLRVDGEEISRIGQGYVVLVAVMEGDTEKDIDYMTKKLCNLRIFEDDEGKMNKSIQDVSGQMLIVSQFTLAGDARKGNRPSFISSAEPTLARNYYDTLCERVQAAGVPVQKGIFAADMKVNLTNDGPVTILLDSTRGF